MSEIVTCPLCGYSFNVKEAGKIKCSQVCRQCSGYCCPNCNYKFPGESKIAKWFEGLFSRSPENSETK